MGMTLVSSDISVTFRALSFSSPGSQGKSRHPHYANGKPMAQRVSVTWPMTTALGTIIYKMGIILS